MKPSPLLILFLVGCLTASTALALDKGSRKRLAREATETFSDTTFVAQIELHRYAQHFVLPDGSPAPQKSKKQGRGGEGAIEFDSGLKLRAGEVGEGIFVYSRDAEEIQVAFNPKRKPLNAVAVNILFDRPVTAEDFEPQRLAQAVSSVAVIRGFEPGAEIAAAFDEALAGAPDPAAAATPPTPAKATVLTVRVWAEPAQVRPGDEVRLVLDYEVQTSGAPVIATETRELSLDGRLMPTYPVADDVARNAGTFTSTYRQPLPASVATGTYSFEGEVCVEGDCIRRSATFVVVRD